MFKRYLYRMRYLLRKLKLRYLQIIDAGAIKEEPYKLNTTIFFKIIQKSQFSARRQKVCTLQPLKF